jgi:hypothetical protein
MAPVVSVVAFGLGGARTLAGVEVRDRQRSEVALCDCALSQRVGFAAVVLVADAVAFLRWRAMNGAHSVTAYLAVVAIIVGVLLGSAL